METYKVQGLEINIIQEDITKIEADVIVNAANSSLMGGGGVDGAIHRKGGPQIINECKKYRSENPPLPTGEAIITSAGKLSAQSVIHTVGPIWQGGGQDEANLLASAYKKSLLLAEQHEYESIAFPGISTGIYGYPPNLAVQVVKKTILNIIPEIKNIKRIIFVSYDAENFRIYTNAFSSLAEE